MFNQLPDDLEAVSKRLLAENADAFMKGADKDEVEKLADSIIDTVTEEADRLDCSVATIHVALTFVAYAMMKTSFEDIEEKYHGEARERFALAAYFFISSDHPLNHKNN